LVITSPARRPAFCTGPELTRIIGFLPMELEDMKRLVLEKGVVQKVPRTPATAVTGRR
jgi:hypothetical protein